MQSEDFDVGAEIAKLTEGNPKIGGAVSFTGLVRDIAGDDPVGAMTLEHYPGMTERELTRVETEAHSRWALEASLIIHRFGRLEPGEQIVLVVTASSHRQDAFDACQFLIDWLKTRAPFWKREEISGAGRWVEAKDEDEASAARWRKSTGVD